MDNLTFQKIKDLEKMGYSIYFVTSRHKTAGNSVIKQTGQWIKKYINLEHFSIIPSVKKGKILNGLDADYFIDDSIENIIEVFYEAPHCKSFLLIREFNKFAIEFIQKSHKYNKIEFVYSVDEFLNEIMPKM